MLYDAFTEAIVSLRDKRKQKVCAKAGGISPGTWSNIETGRTKASKYLPNILKGLGCTVYELWEEKVRLEREYYLELAIANGHPGPTFESSGLRQMVERFYRYDASKIPAEHREHFIYVRDKSLESAHSTHDGGEKLSLMWDEYVLQPAAKKRTVPA